MQSGTSKLALSAFMESRFEKLTRPMSESSIARLDLGESDLKLGEFDLKLFAGDSPKSECLFAKLFAGDEEMLVTGGVTADDESLDEEAVSAWSLAMQRGSTCNGASMSWAVGGATCNGVELPQPISTVIARANTARTTGERVAS